MWGLKRQRLDGRTGTQRGYPISQVEFAHDPAAMRGEPSCIVIVHEGQITGKADRREGEQSQREEGGRMEDHAQRQENHPRDTTPRQHDEHDFPDHRDVAHHDNDRRIHADKGTDRMLIIEFGQHPPLKLIT